MKKQYMSPEVRFQDLEALGRLCDDVTSALYYDDSETSDNDVAW